MTVEKAHKYENCELYEIKGNIVYPGNADDLSGMLVIANKVYYVPEDKLSQVIKLLNNEIRIVIDSPEKYNFYLAMPIVFEFPLFDGQKYGDLYNLMRNDLRYISVVSRQSSYLYKTKNKVEENSVYAITEFDIGSDATMMFEPYVGITEYKFHHRGTVLDFEYELQEYKVSTK